MWCFCDVHLLFLGKYLSLPPPQGARSRELEFVGNKANTFPPLSYASLYPSGKT